jgi:cytidylate kinase
MKNNTLHGWYPSRRAPFITALLLSHREDFDSPVKLLCVFLLLGLDKIKHLWCFRELRMMRKPIITIDGPSGAGKSTISKLLAERLGYTYIDTGALYRVVALKVKQTGSDPEDVEQLRSLSSSLDIALDCKDGAILVFLEGKDVTEDIRTPEMSLLASKVSAAKVVRNALLTIQRKLGEGGGVVVEGRDMGTVVFPEAEVKFFLDASLETRGKRRFEQYREGGKVFDRETITQEIAQRDRDDMKRTLSPLKPADGAVTIDSTGMTIEEVVERMLQVIEQYLSPSSK